MKEPTRSEIETALARILKSDELSGANRLKSLLEYITREQLEGRGDQILGKTIGMDVYGREPTADSDVESIVRVDASRLRRRLEDYYSGSGSSDSIHVSVPKGGYRPVFERQEGAFRSAMLGSGDRQFSMASPRMVLALIAGVAVVVGAFFYGTREQGSVAGYEEEPSRELATLLELSPRAVQARNLAADGKIIVFPATEPDRVRAALAMFEQAMELDPNYHGGYAGASQTTAILAGLSPTPEEAQRRLMHAKELAEKAILLRPEDAWSLSSMAMTVFLAGDYETANRLSKQAIEASDGEPYIHGFDAIISFFSGDFERTLSSTSGYIHKDYGQFRFPWRTTQANAYFHLGDYTRALALFEEGVAHGDATSEVSMAHLIASHHAIGHTEKARQLASAYADAWPASRLSLLLTKLFQSERDAEAVLTRLADAGWVDPVTARRAE